MLRPYSATTTGIASTAKEPTTGASAGSATYMQTHRSALAQTASATGPGGVPSTTSGCNVAPRASADGSTIDLRSCVRRRDGRRVERVAAVVHQRATALARTARTLAQADHVHRDPREAEHERGQ